MKILLVAPIHQEKEFLVQKNLELINFGKVINPFPVFQGHNSWFKALSKLGHTVEVFYYTNSVVVPNSLRIKLQTYLLNNYPLWYARLLRLRSKYYFLSLDNLFRNLKLLNKVLSLKPGLIIISGGTTVIFPMTLKKIKQDLKCKIVLLNGMDPLSRSTVTERKMTNLIDVFFTNASDHAESWKKLGARKSVCLPVSSLEPDIFKKIVLTKDEKEKFKCNVCFVGTLSLARQKLLSELKKYNLKIWGDLDAKTGLLSELKSCYQGKALGETMAKIYNCAKIVLNIHDQSMPKGGNIRTFEICGCGAFQLIDKVPAEWFTVSKELVTYSDITDLKQKVEYFLKHDQERQKIADLGFKRVLRDHTYEKHFERLLANI